MVQRTTVGGIYQQGRAAQGVRVMNLNDDDVVSAVAPVVDPGEPEGDGPPATRRTAPSRLAERLVPSVHGRELAARSRRSTNVHPSPAR